MCSHSRQPRSSVRLDPFDLATIGAGLPFAAACEELAETIQANDVVVQAPPGTGKTTLVPPTIADAFPGEKIIVTAPRRVAVRAAARRLAHLTGTKLGDAIGFTIRGESVLAATLSSSSSLPASSSAVCFATATSPPEQSSSTRFTNGV